MANNMRVLVADKDEAIRHLLSAALRIWKYDVYTAKKGDEALSLLERDKCNFVLYERDLPGIDAIAFAKIVRERSEETYIHMTVLTEKDDPIDTVEALNAGADDILKKPFNANELHARIMVGQRVINLETRLREANETLRTLAMTDRLTGLFNSAAIFERLEAEIARHKRDDMPLGVVMFDLDHFKVVNDTHGHLAGDAVLKQAAERLKKVCRPYDLVGRYGGEEFLAIVSGVSVETTAIMAERVRLSFDETPFKFGDIEIHVTISAGVAAPDGMETVDMKALIRKADTALYEAKRAGRNRVKIAGPDPAAPEREQAPESAPAPETPGS